MHSYMEGGFSTAITRKTMALDEIFSNSNTCNVGYIKGVQNNATLWTVPKEP